ncbi:MAG: YbaK/EbsC family protein [Chloroflexota bacterium]
MTDQPTPAATPEEPPAPAFRTLAIDALEAAGVPFRVVRTEIARSAEESASLQGIPVGSLLRSILVRRAADDFFFVLVPGGRRFNWPRLRALLGTNRLTLPTEEEAKAETGYVRGAITPFGARRPWPVIADATIVDLETVAIGGGARGVNVHLSPADLIVATGAQVVDITVPEEPAAAPVPEPEPAVVAESPSSPETPSTAEGVETPPAPEA